MWDYDRDYTEAYHVEETPHGVFRAKVMRDEYPNEPEHDYGCPLIQVDSRGYGYDVRLMGYGSESRKNDGIPDAELALSRFVAEYGLWDGVEVFNRYLRAFHGGSADMRSIDNYSDYYYVTYDTRAMREFWGQTGEMLETSAPEMSEWSAWIEGDVYGIEVERAVSFDEDGEPDDWESEDHSVWGFYGEQYAKEEALSQLRWAIDHIAEGMLPLAI